MKYSFSGRAALVTGAGSGIGEAIARLLASNGLSVVVSDVSADNAQRVAKLISADGGQAVAFLLSEGSSFFAGTQLIADGGYTAR